MKKPIRIGNRTHKARGSSAKRAVNIGKDLLEARERLPYGQFEIWLRGECKMSLGTAYQYIHVAQRFGDNLQNFEDLPLASLYALAAPSTPDAVIEMVKTGKILPTLGDIKQAKKAHKMAVEGDKSNG